MIHIDFDEPVTISKFWVVATKGKGKAQWNSYKKITRIFYAPKEVDIKALQGMSSSFIKLYALTAGAPNASAVYILPSFAA